MEGKLKSAKDNYESIKGKNEENNENAIKLDKTVHYSEDYIEIKFDEKNPFKNELSEKKTEENNSTKRETEKKTDVKPEEKNPDKKESEKKFEKEIEEKEPQKELENTIEKKESGQKIDNKSVQKDFNKKSDDNGSKEQESKEQNLKEDSKENQSDNEKKIDNDNNQMKSTNKAISQSKRIADAKAVQTEQTISSMDGCEIKKESKKENRGFKLALQIVAGLLLCIYIAGFVYFSGHFYQDVTLNGIDVSNMNLQTAKTKLENFYADYELTLKTIDGKEVKIDANEIDMKIKLNDNFNKCTWQQKPYLWFVYMFCHNEIHADATVQLNTAALSYKFDSMGILNPQYMKKPVDAYIGIQDNRFAIIKEDLGTTINVNTFKNVVKDSLMNIQPEVSLFDMDCYILPKITESDEKLKADLEAKNKYADHDIKLQMDDFTLDLGMEVYEAVLKKNKDGYEISEPLVKEYVKSIADKYDTYGNERVFTTSFDKRKVKVRGKIFGYQLNQEETSKHLYDALKMNKSTTVQAVFDHKGYTLNGENDIGDSYIEVNLSEQKVFAYKDGKKIAEGDCVSGNEAAGDGTPVGLYAIQSKLSPTILRGKKIPVTKMVEQEVDGEIVEVEETTYEYEYESPVTYWMQFNGGIGLHDAANWRSRYGGNIYYYGGSHGCVNLPYNLAQILYRNYTIGDPVVVYFWDNQNRR